MNIVSQITQDVVSSIGIFLEGMGTNIVNLFNELVVTTGANGEQTISVFAAWSLAFVGIGFAAGLIRKLTRKAG